MGIGADFCFGGPDDKIIKALNQSGLDPAVVEIADFYLKGCQDELLSGIVRNVTEVAFDGGAAVLLFAHNLLEDVQNFEIPKWLQMCGHDGSIVREILGVAHVLIHVVVGAAQELKKLLFCENINPIYVEIVYKAVCYNGITGIRLIYITQLVIAI